MLEIIPTEILVHIFNYLQYKHLIKLEILNKRFKNVMRTAIWNHLVLIYKINYKTIKFMIDNYKFTNFNFICTKSHVITDEIAKLFSVRNMTKINLSYCNNITDASVILLTGCRKLILSNCKNITDASIRYLGNCHYLDLSSTKITDESVKYLTNCRILVLYECRRITDISVKLLRNCRILNIVGCPYITNVGVRTLNCHKLKVSINWGITLECLKELKNSGMIVKIY